jgi:hypothetical protein
MNIKSTAALRREIATSVGVSSTTTDLDFIGSFNGDLSAGEKGFFNLFHGIKPDIPNYLRGILKIAEDGQAVYEFIQNAVDCDSHNFWLYMTEDYFLAINNGIPFTERDIAAILNIGQSDKGSSNETGNCDNIGRFGIGFKLVHRLVGENDGIEELCTVKDGEIKGPIMLSWAHPLQLKAILGGDGDPIALDRTDENYYKAPWLFKILLTNFPAQPNEEIKDVSYQKLVPFPSSEFQQMRTHINQVIDSDFDPIKYSKGSIFYIKLGKGKYAKLLEEMESLENGVNYSLNFFKKLQEITINDKVITKRKINWLYYEVPIDSDDFNDINPEYKLCPIKIWFGYSNTVKEVLTIKEQPSFYKYFPLGDEVNQLGFVINCDAFDIESNRRKLQKTNINEKLLPKISELLVTDFEALKLNESGKFDKIFLSVLFSDRKADESNLWKSKLLIDELKTFFDSSIPTDSGYFKKEDCIVKGFKANISLQDVGLSNKHWFKWYSWLEPEISQRAIEELGLKKWYLRKLINEISSETLENYLKSISDTQYILFFKEILSEELTATLKKDLEDKKWIKLNDGNFASLTDFVNDIVWLDPKISRSESDVFLKFGKPSLHFRLARYADKLLEINDDISVISDNVLKLLEDNNLVISKLSKEECSAIISFTERAGIKVTQLPPFFYSRTRILSKLEYLISPEVLNVPSWLDSYIISKPEFNSLPKDMAKHLISEDKIFENLFCDKENFESLVQNFPEELITKFYRYLSHLYKFVPEDFKIEQHDIRWIYTSNNKFSTAESLFTPAFFLKEKPSKLSDYLALIKKQTKLETPHIASIKFIKNVKLALNETYTLSDNISTGTLFSETETLTLLDFLVANKEEDFFEKFTVYLDNNQYSVNEGLGVRNYFTTNKWLRKYIESTQAELELISSKVHNPELSEIGLLENESLLEYLIENDFADTTFVQFVYKYKTNNTGLCKQYLSSLDKIEISSKTDYNAISDEFRIFELITHLDASELNEFRSIIYIDDENLNSEARSGDIWFKIEGKNKKIEPSLSEIVTKYKNKTYSRDAFIDKFKVRNNEAHKTQLKNLFDAKNFSSTEIKDELLVSAESPLNAKQLIFFHFYFLENGKSDILSESISFLDSYKSNLLHYGSEAGRYLDQCIIENITKPFEFFEFPDFTPTEKIWEDDYAIDPEKVPLWLRMYVGEDTQKLELLINAGLNAGESHVVKFRKALKENQLSVQNTHRGEIAKSLLANTLIWINDNCKKTSEQLKPIYDELENHYSIKDLLIPIITSTGLELADFDELKEYHFKNKGWETYETQISKTVWEARNYVIDDTFTEQFRGELKAVELSVNIVSDFQATLNDSTTFDYDFYDNWAGKERVKILTYPQDSFQKNVYYQEVVIATCVDPSPVVVTDSGEIIVLEKLIDSIPVVIKDQLTDEDYRVLLSLKNRSRDNEDDYAEDPQIDDKIDLTKADYQFTEREEQALNELFENNPNPIFYKNWNLATLIKALVDLPEKYNCNVKEAKINLQNSHTYAQLKPVYFEGDEETAFTIMGRSAANGLLYLTAQAWIRLEESNVNLFVNFGGNSSKLFHSQQDILDHAMESSEFQIMRIWTDPTAENVNSILSGDFDQKKLWLVFKMKSSEKVDFLFNSWNPNDKYGDPDEVKVPNATNDNL